MYIDAHLRTGQLLPRTAKPQFTPRPLVSSVAIHGLIALALALFAHRAMLPAPPETPPIPMVFLPAPPPPEATPAPAQPVQQPAPPIPPKAVEQPPPPAIPQVAPPLPPPVKQARPVRPRAEPQARRAPPRPHPVRREPELATAEPAPFAPPSVPIAPAAPPAPAMAPPPAPLLPPRPLSYAAGNPMPDYPESLRQRGEQGVVLLRVEVTADGTAASVSVMRSTGFPRLDQSAVEAVRRWRFHPATRGGRPVAGMAEVPVNFQLASE